MLAGRRLVWALIYSRGIWSVIYKQDELMPSVHSFNSLYNPLTCPFMNLQGLDQRREMLLRTWLHRSHLIIDVSRCLPSMHVFFSVPSSCMVTAKSGVNQQAALEYETLTKYYRGDVEIPEY